MLASHVEGLHQLQQGQSRKCHGPPHYDVTIRFPADQEGSESQRCEQSALCDDLKGKAVGKQSLTLAFRLVSHHIRLDGFHPQGDGREAVCYEVDP